jgi:hypothetical protein
MKKAICLILILSICLCLCGCQSGPLKLINEVKDQYDNTLQQTFYNEETGDYILKEYTYSLNRDKWICTNQKTLVIPKKDAKATNSNDVRIYYNSDLTDNPITIMDNEWAKVSIVKYLAKDCWWEFGYELKIYNKTNKVLTVMFDDCYIMDIQCKPLFSIDHIDAGKTAYFKHLCRIKEKLKK